MALHITIIIRIFKEIETIGHMSESQKHSPSPWSYFVNWKHQLRQYYTWLRADFMSIKAQAEVAAYKFVHISRIASPHRVHPRSCNIVRHVACDINVSNNGKITVILRDNIKRTSYLSFQFKFFFAIILLRLNYDVWKR